MEEQDACLSKVPDPVPPLTPAQQVERILGGVLMVLFLVLLLGSALAPPPAPSGEIPAAVESAENAIGAHGLAVAAALILSGIVVLLVEAPRVLDALLNMTTYVPRSPPAWGGYDCIKTIAFLVVVSMALAMAARSGGGQLAREQMWLVDATAKFLTVAYVVWMLHVRGATAEQMGLYVRSVFRSIEVGLKTYLGYIPVHVMVALANFGLIAAGYHLVGLEEEQMPTQTSIRFLVDGDLSWKMRWMFVGYAVLGAPLVEEVFFRGVLYGALRRYMSWGAAALVSGLLFGAMHGAHFALPLAVLGILLGVVRERSGNLLVPILVHACFNGGTIAILLVSGGG